MDAARDHANPFEALWLVQLNQQPESRPLFASVAQTIGSIKSHGLLVPQPRQHAQLSRSTRKSIGQNSLLVTSPHTVVRRREMRRAKATVLLVTIHLHQHKSKMSTADTGKTEPTRWRRVGVSC